MAELPGQDPASIPATQSLTPTPVESTRLKVLILAYSISPVRGSEYSVGWNHVIHIAPFCDVTVLYGLAGPHMGDLDEITDFERDTGGLAHVRFMPVRPNGLARLLNAPNRGGFLVYAFYLAYRVWHRQAALLARDLNAVEAFDVVHYLCPIGYREPGYLWQLNTPYVWGPVGGLPDTAVMRHAPRPPSAAWKTRAKNFANALQVLLGRRVARAVVRADVLVAATTENRAILRHRFGVPAIHVPENAIPDEWLRRDVPVLEQADGPLRMIWIGSLDYRKSPDLLLAAVSAMVSDNWRLDIVGTGPLDDALRHTIVRNGLDRNITLHGALPRAEVFGLLAASDLHILTSMAEANTTVIWEAMAAGIPTMTTDHCGMHDTVCEACGVRIAVSDFPATRDRFAAAIGALIDDRAGLARLKAGTRTCREAFSWSRRVQVWLEIYRTAITHRATVRGLRR